MGIEACRIRAGRYKVVGQLRLGLKGFQRLNTEGFEEPLGEPILNLGAPASLHGDFTLKA